jgi:hypothetical protein
MLAGSFQFHEYHENTLQLTRYTVADSSNKHDIESEFYGLDYSHSSNCGRFLWHEDHCSLDCRIPPFHFRGSMLMRFVLFALADEVPRCYSPHQCSNGQTLMKGA